MGCNSSKGEQSVDPTFAMSPRSSGAPTPRTNHHKHHLPPPDSTQRQSLLELVELTQQCIDEFLHEGRYLSDLEREAVGELRSTLKRLPHHADTAVALVRERWHMVIQDVDAAASVLERFIQKDDDFFDVFFKNVDNLHAQAKKLIAMFTDALDMVEDTHKFLTITAELGIRHCTYGVGEAQYNIMFGYLLNMCSEVLGPSCDTAFLSAFQQVWGWMRRGMEQGVRSETGRVMQRRYMDRRMHMLKEYWAAVRAAEKGGSDTKSFIGEWYSAAFEKTPYLREKMGLFFGRRQAIISVITQTIEYRMNDPSRAESMLKALGSRHIGYQVREEDYQEMREPFLEALSALHPNGPDRESRAAWNELWTYMVDLMTEGAHQGINSFENIAAPRKVPMALMFTDIENSTQLWSLNRKAMTEAVNLHHRVIRQVISECHGYEVKTIGDSFMVAFKSIELALAAALHIQLKLFHVEWATDIPTSGVDFKGSGPDTVWNRALRVRIGIHLCHEVAPTYDSVHQRYDYYGPDVNVAARVESVACGGQIVMTGDTFRAIQATRVTASPPTSHAGTTESGHQSNLPRNSMLSKLERPGSSESHSSGSRSHTSAPPHPLLQTAANTVVLQNYSDVDLLANSGSDREEHSTPVRKPERDSHRLSANTSITSFDSGKSRSMGLVSILRPATQDGGGKGFHQGRTAHMFRKSATEELLLVSATSANVDQHDVNPLSADSDNGSFDAPASPISGASHSQHTVLEQVAPVPYHYENVGKNVTLKGVAQPVELVSVVPTSLADREFPIIA